MQRAPRCGNLPHVPAVENRNKSKMQPALLPKVMAQQAYSRSSFAQKNRSARVKRSDTSRSAISITTSWRMREQAVK